MLVEIIENQITIPAELLAALEVESGQRLHLHLDQGALHLTPAKESAKPHSRTPDQDIGHYIVDSFSKLEEMVAIMAAVCEIKGRMKPADPQLAQEIGRRLEEILIAAREEQEEEQG